MKVEVGEVQILPVKPQNGLIAFVSCVINGQIYLGNIAVHTRPSGGIRLLFPDKTLPNGKTISLFHPLTRDAGDVLEKAVESAYGELLKKAYRRSGDEVDDRCSIMP